MIPDETEPNKAPLRVRKPPQKPEGITCRCPGANLFNFMRTKGSCRFAAYYKVETYDPRLCVWRVIQKSHATIESAKSAMPKGKQSRIIKMSESGMEVLP